MGASCSGSSVQLVAGTARPRGGLYARSVGGEQTYEAAGVSIAKADAVVERLRAAVESTGAMGFGGFAGLHPLDGDRFSPRPRTRSGRKLILARQRGALRACGADLAAHCINDVSTCEPIRSSSTTWQRTASTSRRSPTSWREPPRSAARRRSYRRRDGGAAGHLLRGGGSTSRGRASGSSSGAPDRRVARGEGVVVGLPSAGVHANGFTLVRRARGRGLRGRGPRGATRLYLDDARRLRARAYTRARHGRRDPRESRACPTRRPPCGDRFGPPGSGQRCSSGSPGMSPRTSFGVSSTSHRIPRRHAGSR